MHTKRASTAQSTFFAHHEEEFNLHIGYELVRDRRDDAFLLSGVRRNTELEEKSRSTFARR